MHKKIIPMLKRQVSHRKKWCSLAFVVSRIKDQRSNQGSVTKDEKRSTPLHLALEHYKKAPSDWIECHSHFSASSWSVWWTRSFIHRGVGIGSCVSALRRVAACWLRIRSLRSGMDTCDWSRTLAGRRTRRAAQNRKLATRAHSPRRRQRRIRFSKWMIKRKSRRTLERLQKKIPGVKGFAYRSRQSIEGML